MESTTSSNPTFSTSFYDKYTQEDENIQAKVRPILNQILENRVTLKELHIQYGIRLSEMINSYRNRLEELNNNYDTLMCELKKREKDILQMCTDLIGERPCNNGEL